MTTDRINVAMLARELGLKPNAVMAYSQEVGCPRSRVAATFSKSEADRVRAYAARKREADERIRTAVARKAVATGQQHLAELATTVPCNCCGLGVLSPARRCTTCEDHYYMPGEGDDRRDDRLRDHALRVTVARSPSIQQVAEYRERTHAALHSRDAWRAALVEVMVHHAQSDAGCQCGAPHYPCPSVETLERVNRGIARRVESYLAMSVEDMKRELYGDDYHGLDFEDAG